MSLELREQAETMMKELEESLKPLSEELSNRRKEQERNLYIGGDFYAS